MRHRLIAVMALALLAAGCQSSPVPGSTDPDDNPPAAVGPGSEQDPGEVAEESPGEEEPAEDPDLPNVRQPREKPVVKGIYVADYTAGNDARMEELIGLVDRTELNTMVINVKNDDGHIAFEPKDEALAAHARPIIKDIDALTEKLHEKNIWLIARIVAFKDNQMAPANPDLAVQTADGRVWRDNNKVAWLNPYLRATWDYNIQVAKEAIARGFDEIQFDYVRFPSDGRVSTAVYPAAAGTKTDAIAGFLEYAREQLPGVIVSADIFGIMLSVDDDQNIGQYLEGIQESVDILSPMIYPSHYSAGNLGLSNPNASPYETAFRALTDAKERWVEGAADYRPWLQDFSWGYPYGPAEVRAQIQATYDVGYSEWLLWNAGNKYTEAALEPAPPGE